MVTSSPSVIKIGVPMLKITDFYFGATVFMQIWT